MRTDYRKSCKKRRLHVFSGSHFCRSSKLLRNLNELERLFVLYWRQYGHFVVDAKKVTQASNLRKHCSFFFSFLVKNSASNQRLCNNRRSCRKQYQYQYVLFGAFICLFSVYLIFYSVWNCLYFAHQRHRVFVSCFNLPHSEFFVYQFVF